jgi:hypothetical protein
MTMTSQKQFGLLEPISLSITVNVLASKTRTALPLKSSRYVMKNVCHSNDAKTKKTYTDVHKVAAKWT